MSGILRRIGIKNTASDTTSTTHATVLPKDTLRPESIHPQFLQHVGFPETADAVVYDPIQGLLAVSTSDGLVKLIGQRGVEATLLSPSSRSMKNVPGDGPPNPTLDLQFLQHRAALLRVCRDGSIQLFSIPGRRLLSSLDLKEGRNGGGKVIVNAVSAIPRSPYILLGCESGECQVVRIASRSWKDTSPTLQENAPSRAYRISTSTGRGGGGGETVIATGTFDVNNSKQQGANKPSDGSGARYNYSDDKKRSSEEGHDGDNDDDDGEGEDGDREEEDEDLMPAARLVVQPYKITRDEVDGVGGVVGLAVALKATDSEGGTYRQLAVIVHRDSGVTVRDLMGQRNICVARDESDDPSKPTATCWVGDRANCFAVGYDDGSVLLFGIPPEALSTTSSFAPRKSQKTSTNRPASPADTLPMDAVLLLSMRIVPESEKAAPIRSITFLAGNPTALGAEDRLLVCGGQRIQDPEMLTLVPLEQQDQEDCTTSDVSSSNQTIPWFGELKAHTVLRPSPLEPPALMLLTQGGQLVVHDLEDWQPYPLTMPLQELPPITVVKFVPSFALPPTPFSITLSALYTVAGQGGRGQRSEVSADWPFTGGEPAFSGAGETSDSESSSVHSYHPSALLFSGHRDGRVRVWDVTTQVPTLLTTVPGLKAAETVPIRAVTCVDVCSTSGMLAVGHGCSGEMRLYRFSQTSQTVRQLFLDESLVPYDKITTQRPGFQCILKYSGTHDGDCTSICLSSRDQLLAVGDGLGQVSVLNLSNAHRLCVLQPFSGKACTKLAMGCLSSQTHESLALFAACIDSTLSISVLLTHPTNQGLSSEIRSLSQLQPVCSVTQAPTSPSQTLDLQLLNARGLPLLPTFLPSQTAFFEWSRAEPSHVKSDADSINYKQPTTDNSDNVSVHSVHGPLGRGLLAPAHGLSSFIRQRRQSHGGGDTVHSSGWTPSSDKEITLDDIDTTADLFGESAAWIEGDNEGVEELKNPLAESGPDQNSNPSGNPNDSEVCYVMLATASFVLVYDVKAPIHKSRDREHLSPFTMSVSVRRTVNLSTDVFGGGLANFCGSFMTPGAGSGLVVVSSELASTHDTVGKSVQKLAVLSIPNLVVADACALHDVLGFPLPPLTSESCLNGTMLTMSQDAQLLFVTPASELVRLTVAEDTLYPNGAASTFNWETAKAARALELEFRGKSAPKVGLDLPAVAARGGSFLYKTVYGAAVGLVEGATAEIERLRAYGPHVVANSYSSANKASQAATSLSGLFRSRPTDTQHTSVHIKGDKESNKIKNTTAVVHPHLSSSHVDEIHVAEEAFLETPQHEIKQSNKRGGVRRTASEIKRVYGHSRAQDARATLERTREMLGERGEKLSQLEEKAAGMRNNAEDFASAAADLEKAFKNRSWWNL